MSTWIEASLHDAIAALAENGRSELAASLERLLEEPELRSLNLYRSKRVEAFADELLECETLDELTVLIEKACSVFAVAHCTVLLVREREARSQGTRILTTYPDEWLSHYIARRYFNVDPVVSHALGASGLFFWDEIGRNDPITIDFLRSASAHGVGPSGVTFVGENVNGDTIAVFLSSSVGHASFPNIFKEKLCDFADIAKLIIDVFSDLACEVAPQKVTLSEDQLKVLHALASGRSQAEVEGVHVSYGSFATLEKSILQSLNAKTLVQAVAIAAKRSLLEAIPFFERDIYRAGRFDEGCSVAA